MDFEDELIRIEAEEMKGRSPFVSPMPIQVVSLLKEQRKYTGQFNYVMPGKHSNQPLSDMVYTSAYRRMDVIELIHPHGWRHVFKTQVTEQGLFNRLEVEIQMAHKISGVEGVYVGTDLLPVRRKLMQSWADCLDGIKEKYRSGSNVVELVAN